MSVIHKAMFVGEDASINCMASNLGVSIEADGVGYWVWGPSLKLGPDRNLWREELDSFSRKANAIIALTDPRFSAISPWGSVQIIDGTRCDHVLMPETAVFETVFFPVTLTARGGMAQPRPIAVRVPELCQRQPRFERAANLLAECGDDLTKLYMVMELIEKQHGGFPKKSQPTKRKEFCQLIQVAEPEWEALHRTARPFRHAEPHEDEGPVLTASQSRTLLQHALKLWLEREVPA